MSQLCQSHESGKAKETAASLCRLTFYVHSEPWQPFRAVVKLYLYMLNGLLNIKDVIIDFFLSYSATITSPVKKKDLVWFKPPNDQVLQQ